MGAYGGAFTYIEQIGDHTKSGFMTNSQRTSQRRTLLKKYGEELNGKEISHVYGTYGRNREYFQFVTKQEHIAFHKIYGYKTNGGNFNRVNPEFHNFWDLIRWLLGL